MQVLTYNPKFSQSNEIDLANNLLGFFLMKLATTLLILISCTHCNCGKFESLLSCSPIVLRNGVFNLLTPEAALSAYWWNTNNNQQLFKIGKQIIVCKTCCLKKTIWWIYLVLLFPIYSFCWFYISFSVIFLNY